MSAEEQKVFIAVTGLTAGVAGCCAAATAAVQTTRKRAMEIWRTVNLRLYSLSKLRGHRITGPQAAIGMRHSSSKNSFPRRAVNSRLVGFPDILVLELPGAVSAYAMT